jgi:curli biogenesis system outer membrane secretion channel CsgG
VAALGALLLVGGCASAVRLYVNPDADMAFYKKIAVMPFGNVSTEPLAGQRVTRAFLTELLMANRYQIVEPEDFAGVLFKLAGPPGQDGNYDAAKIRDAANAVGATGLLRGGVTEYTMQRTDGGDVPLIAFDVELMDVATGNVVWRSSINRRGKGAIPLVGGGTRSPARLTQETCEELVKQLEKEKL